MTRRSSKPAADGQPTSNPHSWLQLNPLPDLDTPGFLFGVLEREFRGRTNSAVEFTTAKIQPVPPVPGGPAITAERAEVSLPRGADDRFSDPLVLAAEIDRAAVAGKPALLGYVTLYYPETDRLHHAWRYAFDLAQTIADDTKVAVITVLHVPARQGSANPVHAHLLLMGPRALTPLGLGAYHNEFCYPRGQRALFERWRGPG